MVVRSRFDLRWRFILDCALMIFVAALLVLVAGCSGSAGIKKTNSFNEPVRSEYRIGAGDTLNIFVYNQPELSVIIPVRPDGKISTPLVEDLVAEGKTASELARDIEAVLTNFIRAPQVNVIITNFVGVYSDQVRVVGQALRPQAIPYRRGMSLLDVMIAVGGLAEFAAGNRARIVRIENGQEIQIKVRLEALMSGGDTSANMPMHPGDVLVIPESRF